MGTLSSAAAARHRPTPGSAARSVSCRTAGLPFHSGQGGSTRAPQASLPGSAWPRTRTANPTSPPPSGPVSGEEVNDRTTRCKRFRASLRPFTSPGCEPESCHWFTPWRRARRMWPHLRLHAAPSPHRLWGVAKNSDADLAHAVEVTESNLDGNLIEWLGCSFDTRQRGLAPKALDSTRRSFAALGGELPRKLARADPRHIRRPRAAGSQSNACG